MKRSFLIFILLLTACRNRVVAPDRSDTEAIQVAFFAEIIEAQPSNAAAAYCISTGPWASRQDPHDNVLNDLRRLFGKVQPASQCDSNNIMYNGQPARAYHISEIMISGRGASATGSYRETATTGATYEATLEKQTDLWVISSFRRTGGL